MSAFAASRRAAEARTSEHITDTRRPRGASPVEPILRQRDQPQVALTNPAQQGPVLGALADVAAYIPGEGIALYVAIYAAGSTAGEWVPWVAAIAALALNGLIISLNFVAEAKAPGGEFSTRRLVTILGILSLILVVYITCLPGNLFQVTWDWGLIGPGIAALILAAFMPFIALATGIGKQKPA
jgi:hypothetical protein